MTGIYRLCTLAIVGLMLLGCSPVRSAESSEPPGVNQKTIEQVLHEHSKELMALPAVVGVAIGLCKNAPCILVMAEKDSAELRSRLPSELDGYPVRIEVTGKMHSLPDSGGD